MFEQNGVQEKHLELWIAKKYEFVLDMYVKCAYDVIFKFMYIIVDMSWHQNCAFL